MTGLQLVPGRAQGGCVWPWHEQLSSDGEVHAWSSPQNLFLMLLLTTRLSLIQNSQKKGNFSKGKNENTHGFKSFQTDSGKKKITFYNGRPPWCAFKLLRHLFLSSGAAVGMTKVASPQWLNLTSSLIKRKATTGEAAISVNKQQDTGISSSCLVEQEIIVLLLLSWPSSLYVQTHIYLKKAFIILSRCFLTFKRFWNWVSSLPCCTRTVLNLLPSKLIQIIKFHYSTVQ